MDENNAVSPIDPSQVFGCDQVLEMQREPENQIDYAIIQLDRPTGLPFVDLSQESDLELGTGLAVIGHPNGLPQKLAAFGLVLENDPAFPYFVASLDTFGGNSGSPVIESDNNQVVGMLVSGEQDYELTDAGCYAVKVCQQDGSNCSGEAVMRVDFLADIIESFVIP
jgi:V8-like Glu-specific endopeptidase